ncbi:MAG: M24 family metallopeptidase [Athalassotoga sp.]|uniref:M24 family metallopeptidase n=1 Tax=Athalassotoga sp. TaxID=2022597 RepID=UPI003D07121F
MSTKERSSKLYRKLKDKGIDYFLSITFERSNTTVRYLSGFTGDTGCVIVGEKERYLLVDSRFYTQAAQESDCEIVKVGNSSNLTKKALEILKGKIVGIENGKFFHSWYADMSNDLQLQNVEEDLYAIRAVKDREEVDKIKRAIEVAQNALKKTLEKFHVGMTEKEFSSLLGYEMEMHGAQKPSFDTIIASGYRGALPHGLASDKKMEKGEMVVVDFGALVDGYCSDITRTFGISKVPQKALDAYLAVLGAQLKAIESAKSGMTGKEIDGVARNFLKEKQLDGYFGGGLGHGLGMDVHEYPFLSEWYDKPINDMAVVTFEPGVYIPGEFGIRIEDDVLLTENGHEVLSNFKKEFTVI